jgi:hypothetical protein
MPIIFLNNYPSNKLQEVIKTKEGVALHGEIWLYDQFLKFQEYDLIQDETWYLKHDYNLSQHPGSKGKVEGQIDFVLLTKNGILIFEVKGGGLRVDENDRYYSYNRNGEYQTQNPFNQVKEYTHTLKELNESSVFVYRAVILPHEAGFKLLGHQLSGYSHLLFSKKDFKHLNGHSQGKAINNLFFEFVKELAKRSRRNIIKELNPSWRLEKVNKKLFSAYPELKSKALERIKTELFPSQSSYGYNPDKINSELIFKENYEILKGLKRNKNVLIQGAPGTGKTVLATKFLAENLLRQHKGIVFCANKLVRCNLEHIIINNYNLDSNSISFRIFSNIVTSESVASDIDFLVFDEAQEYFDNGLFDFINELNDKLENPKILILFDPKQTIISDFKELSWYTDYFIASGYTHYLFDEIHRCVKKSIIEISELILLNDNENVIKKYGQYIRKVENKCEELEKQEFKLGVIKDILDEHKFTRAEMIILVHSTLVEDLKKIILSFFKLDIEELTEENINLGSSKVRFTSPLKYRGLENKAVFLITPELSEITRVQNYVGVTRAMEQLKIILWEK